MNSALWSTWRTTYPRNPSTSNLVRSAELPVRCGQPRESNSLSQTVTPKVATSSNSRRKPSARRSRSVTTIRGWRLRQTAPCALRRSGTTKNSAPRRPSTSGSSSRTRDTTVRFLVRTNAFNQSFLSRRTFFDLIRISPSFSYIWPESAFHPPTTWTEQVEWNVSKHWVYGDSPPPPSLVLRLALVSISL